MPIPHLNRYIPSTPWKSQTVHEYSLQGQYFQFSGSGKTFPVVSISYGPHSYCTHKDGSSYVFGSAKSAQFESSFLTVMDFSHFEVALIEHHKNRKESELMRYVAVRKLLDGTPFMQCADVPSLEWDDDWSLSKLSTETIEILLESMQQVCNTVSQSLA